jgi:hypothetical protein
LYEKKEYREASEIYAKFFKRIERRILVDESWLIGLTHLEKTAKP